MAATAAVVLAAGEGKRMNSRKPKVLHHVCGQPMVSIVVDVVRESGCSPIVVVVPSESSAVRQALGDGVSYAVQDKPLGTGHALLQARDSLDDAAHVAVFNGDWPLIDTEAASEIIRTHHGSGAAATLLTSCKTPPASLGRVLRDGDGEVTGIVEDVDADEQELAIDEVNAGVYCFDTSWMWDTLAGLPTSSTGEIFLTDIIASAVSQGRPVQASVSEKPYVNVGVNTRVQLAQAEAYLRERIRERWMAEGVTMTDPATVYIDRSAKLGADTVILPNTHINGPSTIGSDSEIGPNTIVRDSTIGDRCVIEASVIEGSTLENGVHVGPFSHVRPGSLLQEGSSLGNYAEVKNSRIGPYSKSHHFSYIGDSDIGANVNIGAGTVTCNFDGTAKNRTIIGDDVFIGSDTMLVAPITIGDRSTTSAGSVVTKDVPPDSSAIGVPARIRRHRSPDPNKPDSG